MKNNKGFSLVELLAVVAILGILMGMAIIAYTKYIDYSKKKAYKLLKDSTIAATEEYIMDHPGDYSTIYIEDLVNGDYLEYAADPSDKGQQCKGKIVITPKETENGKLGGNDYRINMCCINYYHTYKSDGTDEVDQRCKAEAYDLTKIPNIKVLNVYPKHQNGTVGDQLKGWMDSYGKGKINVTKVYIQDFNANPGNYLKQENGKWNYDEIVFGFVDCNGSQDLTAHASELVDQYLNEGGAAIFGHDTLTIKGCGSHTNFNKLAYHVNLELTKNPYTASTKVKISRKGIFTEYPWKIGDVGTSLTIPTSHVYGQVAHGDVWITFDMNETEANKIYLSTWGNNAFIQTGHSNGSATPDEQKIIANIIFYTFAKQYVEDD